MSALLRALFHRPRPQIGQTLTAVRAVRRIAQDYEAGRYVSPERVRAVEAKLSR